MICIVFFWTTYACSTLAQTSATLRTYETVLDDFAKTSVNNLNFQNGINVFIKKPESDLDALYQGFRITHTDGEYNGGWEILYAKNLVIQEKIPLNFRAVLYLFRNKQYIVLYRKESADKYYFRLFNAVY
jgi:hypothetical protein